MIANLGDAAGKKSQLTNITKPLVNVEFLLLLPGQLTPASLFQVKSNPPFARLCQI